MMLLGEKIKKTSFKVLANFSTAKYGIKSKLSRLYTKTSKKNIHLVINFPNRQIYREKSAHSKFRKCFQIANIDNDKENVISW